MDLRQSYQILGLTETASPQAVRRAYLELVKIWHPDRFDTSPLLKQQAEEAVKQVNAAYAQIRQRIPASGAFAVGRPVAFWGVRLSDYRNRLVNAYRALERRLRYRWTLMVVCRRHRGLQARHRFTAGRSSSRRHLRTGGLSFGQVLDEVRKMPGRRAADGRYADAGRRWIRIMEKRLGRRRGDAVERIDPIGTSGPVHPVRPIGPK